MKNEVLGYTDEEKRVLRYNTRASVTLIRIGFSVSILALIATFPLRYYALKSNRSGIDAAYIALYIFLLGGSVCSMLGFRSFRKENIFLKTASILEMVSVPVMAVTAMLVYLTNHYELLGLRYGLFTYALYSLWETIAVAFMAKGYQQLLREQEKAYIHNHLKILTALLAGITFFILMIIAAFEVYGAIIFGVAILICCIPARYQISNMLQDIEQEDVTIFCLSVKGKDWIIGAVLFAVSLGIVCLFIF